MKKDKDKAAKDLREKIRKINDREDKQTPKEWGAGSPKEKKP